MSSSLNPSRLMSMYFRHLASLMHPASSGVNFMSVNRNNGSSVSSLECAPTYWFMKLHK